MSHKVTIQDIANELGISRNTVSKAFNNTGILADTTRNKIIKKAIEMGYKQFSFMPPTMPLEKAESNREITLLTCTMPNSSHFGSHLLDTFQEKISKAGYRLSIYMVRQNDINSMNLPNNFSLDNTDGIICIEMFHAQYSKMICDLNKPTLFVDSTADMPPSWLNADTLLMENHDSIYNVTKEMISRGYSNIGFAGDIHHCRSFYERWLGYCSALRETGISYTADNCILSVQDTEFSNPQKMAQTISQLKMLPKVLICANDFVAIDIMRGLKLLNITIPQTLLLTGFDDSTESRIVEPHLTTVAIPSASMGYIAGDLLLSRIADTSLPYRTLYTRTNIIYRSSTGDM